MEPRRNNTEAHFEELITRLESVSRRKGFDDLRELARLYRLHSARLARLQTRGRDRAGIRYLNGLCVRAYNILYSYRRKGRHIAGWLSADLPAVLAQTWRLQLLVAGLLAAAIAAGIQLGGGDADAVAALIPDAMYSPEALAELANSASARAQFLGREETPAAENTAFGGYLFLNNTQVGALSFAVGILGGVPSVLLVVFNGLTIGGFASIFVYHPDSLSFWAWIVPHAIPELLAIVLCATGGLVLGIAMVAPGRAGRGPALARAGSQAIQLVLASVPLFFIAALIESFVRQSGLTTQARFAVAAAVTLALCGYILLVRALARRQPKADASFLAAAC